MTTHPDSAIEAGARALADYHTGESPRRLQLPISGGNRYEDAIPIVRAVLAAAYPQQTEGELHVDRIAVDPLSSSIQTGHRLIERLPPDNPEIGSWAGRLRVRISEPHTMAECPFPAVTPQSESAPSGDRAECRLKYDAASNRLWCGEHCCYSEDCPKPDQSGGRGASQPVGGDEREWTLQRRFGEPFNVEGPSDELGPITVVPKSRLIAAEHRAADRLDGVCPMSCGRCKQAIPRTQLYEGVRCIICPLCGAAEVAPEESHRRRAAEADRDRLQRRVKVLEDDTNRDGFSVLHGPGGPDDRTVPLAQVNRKFDRLQRRLGEACPACGFVRGSVEE